MDDTVLYLITRGRFKLESVSLRYHTVSSYYLLLLLQKCQLYEANHQQQD